MVDESTIIYEDGDYFVIRATFGSGRFKPKSEGFRVYQHGITAASCVATIGYSGQVGLDKAVAEIERRQSANN